MFPLLEVVFACHPLLFPTIMLVIVVARTSLTVLHAREKNPCGFGFL